MTHPARRLIPRTLGAAAFATLVFAAPAGAQTLGYAGSDPSFWGSDRALPS